MLLLPWAPFQRPAREGRHADAMRGSVVQLTLRSAHISQRARHLRKYFTFEYNMCAFLYLFMSVTGVEKKSLSLDNSITYSITFNLLLVLLICFCLNVSSLQLNWIVSKNFHGYGLVVNAFMKPVGMTYINAPYLSEACLRYSRNNDAPAPSVCQFDRQGLLEPGPTFPCHTDMQM